MNRGDCIEKLNMKRIKKIGYVRTSRPDLSTSNQILQLKKDKQIPEIDVFVDEGISGTVRLEYRKGYLEMLKYLEKVEKEGKYDSVEIWVYEVSRLGRSFREVMKVFFEIEMMFPSLEVRVYSLSPKESWMNTSEESIRKLLFSIFSWVAERERDMLIERTKAGLERAKKEGKRLGRPPSIIVWKEVKKYAKLGYDMKGISKVLNIPYTTLINNIRKRGMTEEIKSIIAKAQLRKAKIKGDINKK